MVEFLLKFDIVDFVGVDWIICMRDVSLYIILILRCVLYLYLKLIYKVNLIFIIVFF